MTLASPCPFKSLIQRSTVALAMVGGCGAAVAASLPDFTLAPSTLATGAAPVTADNMLISDFAKVLFGPGNTFSESGFLAITGFQLDGMQVMNAELNNKYGLYVEFAGTGTLSQTGNPSLVPNFGSFSTLTYTLYGYKGPAATFAIDSKTNNATTTAVGAIALASGSLMSGSVASTPGPDFLFSPSASAKVSFNVLKNDFFTAPSPFYNMAFASFTNSPSQVTVFAGGFNIEQGGGSINFAAPIPEPETYALMLAGLGAVAFVARRRRRID